MYVEFVAKTCSPDCNLHMMKRRNADPGKIRRPMKPRKIAEGVYSSLFTYIKFLAVWGLVLLADFILEFRFEYLYPVWLLIRTVENLYKYQGMVLTMLFIAIAVATDVICYMFIPVQWLFFAASSYVWVQYVWHTDKGICLSSVSLWLLFVYVEAALRMKDHKILPFHLDLCRPFAAHCIGYPVVNLGYGVKTCASETMRKRTRNQVVKSNKFYMRLLQDSLPLELQEKAAMEQAALEPKEDDASSECSEPMAKPPEAPNTTPTLNTTPEKSSQSNGKTFIEDFDYNAENEAREIRRRNINNLNEETENMLNDSKNKSVKDVQKKLNTKKTKNTSTSPTAISPSRIITEPVQPHNSLFSNSTNLSTANTNDIIVTANGDTPPHKSEFVIRLEADVKRLKADLQSSRNTEQELRSLLNSKHGEDRQQKGALAQLQQDNENLQNKLHNLVTSRQQDKQNLAALEKKLQEERRIREKSEALLAADRKAKKQEDQVAARAVAIANANRSSECSSQCKAKGKEMEESLSQYKWDLQRRDDQIRQLEHDSLNLRKFKEAHTDSNEVLMSALAAMQDKTMHLENSLSAETKIKMELFSALGEAKRQLEIQCHILAAKEKENSSLRSHITEALALVPSSTYAEHGLGNPGQYTTPKLGSPTIVSIHNSSYGTTSPTEQLVYTQHTQPLKSTIRYSPSLPGGENTNCSNVSSETDTASSTGLNPQAKDYQPTLTSQ